MIAAIVTPIPSPYQVELFDALRAAGVEPRTAFVERSHADRHWKVPTPQHEHLFLEDGPPALERAHAWAESADILVVSWYADPRCRQIMNRRAAGGKPWAYWGERPGVGSRKWLGRLRRRIQLRQLRGSLAPIWGIGGWAIPAWEAEFGDRRPYFNVPYFSDTGRFARPANSPREPGVRRFLVSGSLILRKGLDLLADAFAGAAESRPGMRLEFVGSGEMEGALRQRLAALGDRVRFRGFVPWEELPIPYHGADILVAPSRYDGWGLIVPEGLAAGLPVIGTDRTGAALDLIEPGRNGWRIPAGDGAALAKAVAEAADMTDTRLAEMSAVAVASAAGHSLAEGARRWTAAAAATIAGWKTAGGSSATPKGTA